MLKQIEPLPTRSLFSLQMASSKLQYSKYSYSFKQQYQSSYLCIKTQPLKFSIIMFQNNCLINVRSFSLKTTSNRQICFLNLETKTTPTATSQEECYEILVGYQTGQFDIYSIVGNNAKLIEASKETQIPRKQFIETVYQHHHNQILIINKNVLTSIQISYPFRLKREQDISPINSCQVSKSNSTLATGGNKGVILYQVVNFTKLKSINIECQVLKMSVLGGYYVGNGDLFSWIDAQGNIKSRYERENNKINNVEVVQDVLWVIFDDGEVGCLEQKNKVIVSGRKKVLQIQDQTSNHSKQLMNSGLSEREKQNIRTERLQSSASKELERDAVQSHNESVVKQQSFIDQLEQLKIEEYENGQKRRFTKSNKMDIKERIVSVKVVGNLIVLLNQRGILSIRQITRK